MNIYKILFLIYCCMLTINIIILVVYTITKNKPIYNWYTKKIECDNTNICCNSDSIKFLITEKLADGLVSSPLMSLNLVVGDGRNISVDVNNMLYIEGGDNINNTTFNYDNSNFIYTNTSSSKLYLPPLSSIKNNKITLTSSMSDAGKFTLCAKQYEGLIYKSSISIIDKMNNTYLTPPFFLKVGDMFSLLLLTVIVTILYVIVSLLILFFKKI